MDELTGILRERFGLNAFHAWQRETVDELLRGKRRALVVAPTGGGKSLCYQFPASILEGTTIVISPLIALMEDQVRSLQTRGISATYLASTLDREERRRREEELQSGRYRLVYVAPERLTSGPLLRLLAGLRPALVAVDEAHCISQWGHDFRPSYLHLDHVLRTLRPAHVLACTATATPVVRREIIERLGLPPGDTPVILRGFARPNLHLEVIETERAEQRRTAMLRALRQALGQPGDPRGTAIVYAATRKNSERVAATIQREGWRVEAYHAGLPATDRETVSRRFAEGHLDIVVATNAFGMGIDRPDIRVVVHVQAPGSVEAYYQEVGRAGRDGQPAHGLLLTGSSDFVLRRRLIGFGDSSEDSESDREQRQHQWQLFLDLMSYVEAGSCRHDFVLRYFGDERETLGGCGHCDVCERLEAQRDAKSAEPDGPASATLIVRQALAGVARNRGRAGLSVVAAMLHGTDNRRLRDLGMTSLSTHGILQSHSAAWITGLLRRLVTARLVDLTPSDYPVPMITPAGIAVMQGKEPCRVLLPPAPDARERGGSRRKPAGRAIPEGLDAELVERLRTTRRELAATKGVPAYVICHDRTLHDIALLRPQTLQELGQAYGMGPARTDHYGVQFLAAVKAAP